MSRIATHDDAHDPHSSFIKTPQQLVVVILLSFLVPILGIISLVQLVVSAPSADPNALKPEAIAARIHKGAMPPRGGSDATDTELARAIVYMANQSGANLKEPASKPAAGKSK